ncbi:MAG: extracellular solute-binding protein [Planctomycetes bacterium]|nr:extracellular solute-binding protein [Planctomycetota bacterium]
MLKQFMRGGPRKTAFRVAGGILLAAAVLVVLAGCGAIGGKYVYIEWYMNNFEKYFPRWLNEFEKLHADEHVRVKSRAMTGSIKEKVYTMLISNTLSDCIYIGPDSAALLMENDALEPVTDADIDRDDFPPLTLHLATDSKGTLVGIPAGLGMRPFVYYNRDCLDEAGTSEAEIPDTYDDYRKWAAKLFKWKVDGGTVVGPLDEERLKRATMVRRPFAMMRGFLWSSIPILASHMEPLPDADGESDGSLDDYFGGPPSGRPFRFDNPEFVKGLRDYVNFYLPKKGAVVDGDTTRVPAFIAGTYAGVEASNWIYGEVYTVNMVATRMPHAPGMPARLYMNSTSTGISRGSKHKRLAFEFAKFINSADSQIDSYYGHGYLPGRFSAWKQLEANEHVEAAIRKKFLSGQDIEQGGYVGVPRIKRRNHDTLDLYLWVPLDKDTRVLTVSSKPGGDASTTQSAAGHAQLAESHTPLARRLAEEVSQFAGVEVNVIVQGTPKEMIASRSYVTVSPVSLYAGLLEGGIWVPISKMWDRLLPEVITRLCQKATIEDESVRLSPEEAARWAQKEAEDIMAGRK